jgi:hypothetical protein
MICSITGRHGLGKVQRLQTQPVPIHLEGDLSTSAAHWQRG